MSKTRNEYLSLRHVFAPENLKLIIIAESPPTSGRYFYDPEGAITEPLFAAMMKELHLSVATKESGLREFQRKGWLLVDATYEPVNMLKGAERDKVILRNYPTLVKDIRKLVGDKSIPLVLVKVNVCKILESKLVADRFDVLNHGRAVSFPSTGQQSRFHAQFSMIVASPRKTPPIPS